MIHYKLKTTMVLLAITMCLSACGNTEEEKELADFSSSMSDFTSRIQEANEEINNIDTTKEEAYKELLSILDTLDEEFKNLAELEVPEQYLSIESLANEASENMTNAVNFYHTAYESDPFSEQDAYVAYQYYTRAMTRVQYIGYLLVGEIPESDNVTIYEGTDDQNLINKLLHPKSEDNGESEESTSTTYSIE